MVFAGRGGRKGGRGAAGRWSKHSQKNKHQQKGKYNGPRIPNKLLASLLPVDDGNAGSNSKNDSHKRKRDAPPHRGMHSKRTRFDELLTDMQPDGGHTAAIAAEDALQARLAKKLGLERNERRKRKQKGGKTAAEDTDSESDGDTQQLHGKRDAQKRRDTEDIYGQGSRGGDSGFDIGMQGDGKWENGNLKTGKVGKSKSGNVHGNVHGNESRSDDGLEQEGMASDLSDSELDMLKSDSEDAVDSEEMDGQTDSDLDSLQHGDGPDGQTDSEETDEQTESDSDGFSEESDLGAVSGDAIGQNEVEVMHNARRGSAAGASTSGRYVPPALRNKATSRDTAVARRIRGLLNRLSDSNLQGIVGDLVQLYESGNRLEVTIEVTEQLLQAVAEGPRATDKFAAVTACCVAALAGKTHSQRLAAHFLQSVAQQLEQARTADRTVSAVNLVNVFAHIYGVGLIGPEVLYGLLQHLRDGFSETDVALIAAVVQACGMQMRSDDATAMKEFVLSVHARAAEVSKVSKLTPRAEAMLGLVLDVKNNRGGSRKGAPRAPLGTLSGVGRTAAALGPGVLKWVGICGVAEVQLRNLTWQLLLLPEKKGHWWLGQATRSEKGPQGAASTAVLSMLSTQGPGEGPQGPSADELLKLAAQQRFNTDSRRAVFVALMGSSDVADAAEKLISLPLKGEQEREIIRVTVECCLQEATWNPYYAHLILRLLQTSKSHRITLQYCLWDHFNALHADGQTDGQGPSQGPKAQLRRNMNLARLAAMLIGKSGVGLQVLKVVDFAAPMTSMELLTWRSVMCHSLGQMTSTAVTDAVARLLATPGLKEFSRTIATFVDIQVVPWLQNQKDTKQEAQNVKMAVKLLRKGVAASI